jgi:hypothetical protein
MCFCFSCAVHIQLQDNTWKQSEMSKKFSQTGLKFHPFILDYCKGELPHVSFCAEHFACNTAVHYRDPQNDPMLRAFEVVTRVVPLQGWI